MRPNGRRVSQKPVKYKTADTDDEEEDADFQDSGSEASVHDESDSSGSEEDFKEKPVVVKSAKKSAPPPKRTTKPPVNNLKRALQRNSTVQRSQPMAEEDSPLTVKDLTDQQKLLPEFLNLSESDSDSDDERKGPKKSNSPSLPLEYVSYVEQNIPGPSHRESSDRVPENINSRLSDSDSDAETSAPNVVNKVSTTTAPLKKLNFQHLHDHTKKMEEARKSLEAYNLKQNNKKQEDTFNVSELLALGEEEDDIHPNHDQNEDISDSDVDDLEEVKESKSSAVVPKEGIQVTVDLPTAGRIKKPLDLEMMMKRRINRVKKEYQVYMHKVHVLAWIAHGNYINKILNHESLMGAALSLLPSEKSYPNNRVTLKYLEQIAKWFSDFITVKEDKNELKFKPKREPLLTSLLKQISLKTMSSKKSKLFVFICLIRSLGIKCRLVLSFQVISLRPPATELISLSNKKVDKIKRSLKVQKSKTDTSKKRSHPVKSIPQLDGADDSDNSIDHNKKKKKKLQTVPNKKLNNENDKNKPSTSLSHWDKITQHIDEPKKRISHRDLNKPNGNVDTKASIDNEKNKSKTKQNASEKSLKRISKKAIKCKTPISTHTTNEKKMPQKDKPPKKSKTSESDKKMSRQNKQTTSDYFKNSLSDKEIQEIHQGIKKFKENCTKANKCEQSEASSSKLRFLSSRKNSKDNKSVSCRNLKSNTSRSRDNSENSDHDFVPIKKKLKEEIDRRVLSTDDEHPSEDAKKRGTNFWCEVYVEEEEQWISVDIFKGHVHCASKIYNSANHPVAYVVSWDSEGYIKDVTQRYVPHWNTVTRKLRVDADWYVDALRPWKVPRRLQDRREDEQLNRMQLDAPLPKSISEFKNHPLYALKRHLLKFEVIYPPDALVLGFVRNEAVYARECVHVCRSRETWVKEAKVVKLNEKPYKIVKARPKYDRLSGKCITDIPLEVFGPWQVDDYVPPRAEDGKVPRNPYGNVELFKPCMLPGGTVHLNLPGLNKVAKKLGIDCAPAMVGFDYHSGGSHPVYEGFVVCEEFKETLIIAWEQEQADAEQRAIEKVEKRVYGNWKRLIRGLLIRERLQAKYDFQTDSQEVASTSSGSNKRSKASSLATKKQKSG